MDLKDAEAGTTTQTHLTTETASDEGFIENLGYEQEYRRVFHAFGNFALALSFMAPLFAIFVGGFYQVIYGGYWGLSWGWIIPAVLFLSQPLAIAELCSSMPVNGAAYWWTAALAPPRYSRPLSFVAGWMIFVTDAALLASVSFAVSSSYSALIPIAHPDWIPTNAQKMAIAMAIVSFWAIMNLARLENLKFLIHGCAIFILCTSIVFMVGIPAAHAAHGRPFTSGHRVFAEYTNFSDWDDAVAVPFTWFTVAFTLAGWQGPAYIVEETRNARTAAPKGIIIGYVVAALMGFVVCLISAFCIEDIQAAAADSTGFPLFSLVLANFGRDGGLAFLLLVVTCSLLCGGIDLFAMSSQLAAFARDGGLPFSKTFAYVHPRSNMPLPAMALLCVTAFVLLIFSLSSIAGPILYSLAVISILGTLGLPVALRLFAGERFFQGPFHYGKLSWPIHLVAVLTTVYMMIMESFPLSPHWTAATLNYNWCVTLGAVVLVAVGWFVHGHRHYQGVNLDALETFRTHVHGTSSESRSRMRAEKLS